MRTDQNVLILLVKNVFQSSQRHIYKNTHGVFSQIYPLSSPGAYQAPFLCFESFFFNNMHVCLGNTPQESQNW